MNAKKLILAVCIWQLAMILILVGALQLLPLQETFVGGGNKIYVLNPYLYSRGNFDGVHYVHIATQGYGYAEQAFFPLYPNLIRIVNGVVHEPYLTGLVISLASFVLALWIFGKLLALDYAKKMVFWIITALLIFPTSFYFGAVYTESLFFLLVVAAFYSARKGHWLLAAILGGLASYSRFVGIFLLPAMAIEWWTQHKTNLRSPLSLVRLLCLALVPMGLLTFMAYLNAQTGDPLAFLHSLPLFGSFRSDRIIMLYQVFWRYTKMIWTVQKGTLLYSNVIYEAALGFLFFVLTIYSFFRLRLSYVAFMVLAYLAPTLTGSFVSIPRYVLICFPGFIILGNLLAKHATIRKIYLVVCAATFILLTALFSVGFWVA